MQKMKKKLISGLLVLAFFFMGIGNVFADGMVINQDPRDPYSGEWDYSDESDQQAFINYQDGMEKMIVSVKIDDIEDKNAVWVFPVPAEPAKVAINMVEELPEMNGVEISSSAKSNLAKVKNILFGSQIYPLFFNQSPDYYSHPMADDMPTAMGITGDTASDMAKQDVVVYEHLDKEGMSSELITAKTANGIYDYFNKKGLKIQKDMIPALDAYIGKDYSFVVSWINNATDAIAAGNNIQDLENTSDGAIMMPDQPLTDDGEGNGSSETDPQPSSYIPLMPNYSYPDRYEPYPQRSNIKGISVYFPTDNIYFPLLPTSVYGSKTVPATIKVVGLVNPRIYEGIKNFTEVNYYSADYYSFVDSSGKESDFFDKTDPNYTKIEINAPSKFLTEDLWMRDQAPLKTLWTYAIAASPWPVAAILLVLCSLAAVFIAGLLLFKGLRKKPGKLALLGLANCFTIVGMVVAALRLDSGEAAIGKNESALIDKLKTKDYAKRRRNAKIFFTAAVLVFLFIAFGTKPLFSWYDYNFGYYFYMPYQILILAGLLFLYLPPVLAFLGWRAARVAPEDKPLFDELKAKGYSTWSLAPKSKNRGLFVVFFSLVFLAMADIAVWLLQKTV